MEHVSQPEALSYLAGRLSEERVLDVDEHLAVCGRCAEKVRALRILGTQFSEIWRKLNPPVDSEAYWSQRIANVLRRAEDRAESSELRERIRGWLHELHAKTEAALEILMDTTKRSAGIICGGAEQLVRSGSSLRFEPVSVRVARRGAKTPPVISVRAEGPPWFNVTVDSHSAKVIIESDMLSRPRPLVLLVPENELSEAIVGVFQEKNNHLVYEFADVPNGKYKLFIQKFA